MKGLFIAFGILLFGHIYFSTEAQVYQTQGGYVEFLSKAPLNEFKGTSDKLKGLIDLQKNVLDFYVDLNTLNTGIKLRDKHMRDNYLETKKYPFAEFNGAIKEVVPVGFKGTQQVTAKGKFKIHGVEKTMEIPGTLIYVNENKVQLKTSFPIKLSDFGIAVPSVLFYELSEEQIVSIDTPLTLKN
jgi:polyisoprenoid-binding protein YceI